MSGLQDGVTEATIFTKLDLKDGYSLVCVKEGYEWKTAFHTHYGWFEYTVVPFELANAPSPFQNIMNEVLRVFLDQGVVVHPQDIAIYSSSQGKHEVLVSKVCQQLQEEGLTVSLNKSVFNGEEVQFLAYSLSDQEVSMLLAKVESLLSWQAPRSIRDVHIFFGFANFH